VGSEVGSDGMERCMSCCDGLPSHAFGENYVGHLEWLRIEKQFEWSISPGKRIGFWVLVNSSGGKSQARWRM